VQGLVREMETSSDLPHVLYEVIFGGVVTGFKIVATIMAKSRDTLNTITRQIPKFFLLFLFHLVAIS